MTTPRYDPHTGMPAVELDSTVLPPAWALTPAWANPPALPAVPGQSTDQAYLAKIEHHLDSIRSMMVFFTYLAVFVVAAGIIVAVTR